MSARPEDAATGTRPLDIDSEKLIAVGSEIHHQIQQFLIREALLLDHQRYRDWAALLAEDLSYHAPVRLTRNRQDHDRQFADSTGHFDDDYQSILGRVGRLLDTRSAWAENPASRTRRFITNVTAFATELPDEFDVISYLLVSRNRGDEDSFKFMSAERHDRLRRVDGAFKLARRSIFVDQSILGMPNFSIFL